MWTFNKVYHKLINAQSAMQLKCIAYNSGLSLTIKQSHSSNLQYIHKKKYNSNN